LAQLGGGLSPPSILTLVTSSCSARSHEIPYTTEATDSTMAGFHVLKGMRSRTDFRLAAAYILSLDRVPIYKAKVRLRSMSVTYGILVAFDIVEDIGYFMRPGAQQYGTLVFIPRPRRQVDVTFGSNVKFRSPCDFAVVVHGHFRSGKHTRSRIH